MTSPLSIWWEIAAWVEAVGAISAVVGASWVSARESRAAVAREARARLEADRREERAFLATRTAALNLAILAATQIHDLHVQLDDDAWRGRLTRVSPSHTLLSTERMLTAFPIQSLQDSNAMVEFSRFPAALDTAAEIYANLERLIRAAREVDRAAIFTEYTAQMQRVDAQARLRLDSLRIALHMTLPSPSVTAGVPPGPVIPPA
jgi:hypothetical protein